MAYVGDYQQVKERCKPKIDKLAEEFGEALELMGYGDEYIEASKVFFAAEIDDLIESVMDQIEAEIIGGIVHSNQTSLAVGSRSVCNVPNRNWSNWSGYDTVTETRTIGKEKKMILGKDKSPKES